MQVITMKFRVLLVLVQFFIFFAICFHTWMFTSLFKSSDLLHISPTPIKMRDETIIITSTRSPMVFHCNSKYKVAFTFDDGPHPINTPLIVKTLRRQKVKAGFFLLGTSIQSFLSANNNLSVHTFERPRIGFLLMQDYSLVEKLFEGHEIYLHGWLHEKVTEMYLQTVVDNISTQLLEIGLLKGFKPIYRAPWGIGTAPSHIKNKALLPQILNQMGILPVLWNVDTKDYFIKLDENKLINNTLKMICKNKGGHILMHDNRPTTAYYLDRLIRSIRASGHIIVTPGDIDRMWNNQTRINKTRKYTELLRERTRNIQNNRTTKSNNYRPVEIFLFNSKGETNRLNYINPVIRYEGSIKVSPNINDA